MQEYEGEVTGFRALDSPGLGMYFPDHPVLSELELLGLLVWEILSPILTKLVLANHLIFLVIEST
jgi:hypothetical protein